MKKSLSRIAFIALLGTFTAACSQKKDNLPAKNSKMTTQDSASAVAEKKAKAKEEMDKLAKPYHPEENAEAKLTAIIKQAQKENKNIMIQAGGNWCIWCLRFNNFVQTTPELKTIVDKNYIYYHLNYSPENKNSKIFAKYGNPGEKFGYPVFIVLDKNGRQIHTQDSSVLEEGNGYSAQKVREFFLQWAPKS